MRRAGTCDSIASRPARRFADDDRSDLVVVTCFCLVSECVSGVSECITGGRPGGRVPTESRPAQTSRGPIERCFRAVRSRAKITSARAQGPLLSVCSRAKEENKRHHNKGERDAGPGADPHVYRARLTGRGASRAPTRCEKST